jgi:hypothetical protein
VSVQAVIAAILTAAIRGKTTAIATPVPRMGSSETVTLAVALGRLGQDPGGLTDIQRAWTTYRHQHPNATVAEVWQLAADAGALQEGATGPAVAALETWLRTLGLYQGAIDGEFGPLTNAGVVALQGLLGVPGTGQVGSRLLPALRSGLLLHQAARQHTSVRLSGSWPLPFLSWVSGYSVSALVAANHWTGNHGSGLVRWPSHSVPALSGSIPVSVPGSHSRGIVALVVVGAPGRLLTQLAQKGANTPWTAAVYAAPALTDPATLSLLRRDGDEIEVAGYSGIPLSRLNAGAADQEVAWGTGALTALLGSRPRFLVVPDKFSSDIAQAASSSGLVAVDPTLYASGGRAALLGAARQARNGSVLAFSLTPHLVSAWPQVLTSLRAHHLWPVSLAQLEAAQQQP